LAHGFRGFNHGQLVLLFLGCGEAEYHGGKGIVNRDAHLMAARKQRKIK
jgi:hypothetical protein